MIQHHVTQIVEHRIHVYQILHGFQENVQYGATVFAHQVRGVNDMVFFCLVIFPVRK